MAGDPKQDAAALVDAGSSTTVVSDLDQAKGEFSFTISGPLGEDRVRFWGDIPDNTGKPLFEAALAVALLPAMAVGGRLSIPGPLSPQLLRALPDVQAVLEHLAMESPLMDRRLQPVDVSNTDDADRPLDPAAGIGTFFSGGIDSWQTLLANPDITDLIYVHGFDIAIDQPQASATVESRLADTARRRGKPLRIVRTDLRRLLDRYAVWDIAHGPVMAAVALLFAPSCERILIPSSNPYTALEPRGSHPLHDHLWSTEWCRIEHHGAHLTRAEKTEQVAPCQDALDVLRVCWRDVDRYNCGRCEKCLRTMVALDAIGALGRCPTFAVPLDLNAVANLNFPISELSVWWRDNLALARRQNARAKLLQAIEACLAANEVPPPEGEALAQEQLQSVLASRSWRLTAPLRRLGDGAHRIKHRRSTR